MLKFKVPLADQIQYETMLQTGFKTYPKRYENYKKYLKNKRSIKPDFMPIKADIENVSRCNFRCSHCMASTYTSHKGRANDLSFDEYKKFINEQYGLIEVKIQGVGEPFLDKHFTDMVKYASDRYIWVRTTSNGSLLHQNDNYKKIIDSNVGELQISIDGADAKTFEAIRIGGKFDRVTKNCILLNEYANKTTPNLKTRMWSVLQNRNFHQSKDLVKLARDLGFKRVTLSIELRGWEGYEELNKFANAQKVNKVTQEWLNALDSYANEIGIELTFWYATARFSKKSPCFWPFERFLLSSDKFIVPCCTICDPYVYNYGRIDNFNEIWFNGGGLMEFRKMHLNGNIPDICKNCYGD
ncbi:radical SAM protein [Campylobacter fetus]|uniref:Radical SAM core domain-containing protein n=1 Tax=Campylobacter fetus subsp. testudinum TaxID=1507806 RepID=A0AAX0H9J0_CAMFE|nr:radical SAM protein [Campylobacter fetus]EAK0827480.1 radical SAM/SPASM domain-containing protein [Campylobacter fetus]OCR90134.1 hypothetical protein CFT12S02225_08450 [Campylobacter fetus subsp. testudinum]OCR92401.1 hypothetical protein CFT12S02263_06285 [Campylobacter fetus subsp. testudinum]